MGMVPWDKLVERVAHAKERIRELKLSCCDTARHCIFDDLLAYVDEVEQHMKTSEAHKLDGEAERKMLRCGEVLGKLSMGCCNPWRLSGYNECVALLNEVLLRSALFSKKT